jgi:iron complex transport system substrate-binding protein
VGLFCWRCDSSAAAAAQLFSPGELVQRIGNAKWQRTACVTVVTLFLCAVQVCAQADANNASPVYKDFVDEFSRTVHVPQPVQRIVSLAPSLTETVYALGLQDRLVGDTEYCDYPPDAQKKTKVGGAINPSLEQIFVLHPDVVLVTKSINRLETVHALDDLGLASYATDPHNVDEIISSTQRLAEVLGAPEAGKAVAEDLTRRLAALHDRIGGAPPRRVLFVVWTDPLITIGTGTFIADALRRAGAVSIVESTQDWPQMSLEEVVHLQPEYLVFASSHSDNVARDFDALAIRPGWRLLEAVRNRKFAVISDAVNRPAPRIVSAIEDLAHQLHSEAFLKKAEPEIEKKKSDSPSSQNRVVTFPSPDRKATALQRCLCAR